MTLHGDKIDFLRHHNSSEVDHNRIIRMSQQIIKSLEKLHSIGYVHCDIKPQNILFNNPEEEKDTISEEFIAESMYTLIDFGICTKYLDPKGMHIRKEKIK